MGLANIALLAPPSSSDASPSRQRVTNELTPAKARERGFERHARRVAETFQRGSPIAHISAVDRRSLSADALRARGLGAGRQIDPVVRSLMEPLFGSLAEV